jgi:hypothetical protein
MEADGMRVRSLHSDLRVHCGVRATCSVLHFDLTADTVCLSAVQRYLPPVLHI